MKIFIRTLHKANQSLDQDTLSRYRDNLYSEGVTRGYQLADTKLWAIKTSGKTTGRPCPQHERPSDLLTAASSNGGNHDNKRDEPTRIYGS